MQCKFLLFCHLQERHVVGVGGLEELDVLNADLLRKLRGMGNSFSIEGREELEMVSANITKFSAVAGLPDFSESGTSPRRGKNPNCLLARWLSDEFSHVHCCYV